MIITRPIVWRLAFAALLLLALYGCGGGSSGGGGDTPAPGSSTGSLSLGITGGAPTGYSRLWVTVEGIALHAEADRPWSATDGSWRVFRFSAPRTIDLTESTNGVITSLLSAQTLPSGTYGQMRLLVLRHDEPLAASATTLGLAHNAQAEYSDNGTLRKVPIEMTETALGLRIAGPIEVSSTASTDLTVQWSVEESLVRFAADDGVPRVTLRPSLRIYDLAKTGAIIGLIDKTLFCTGSATTGCVYDVVATAQRPSADGRFMVSVRSTPVVIGTDYAAFALYPLPQLPAGETFEVVIRGRNMRTIVVRDVPAEADDLLAASPTQLGVDFTNPSNPVPAPIQPVLSTAGDARVTLNTATVPPSAQLRFGQTIAGMSVPLEVAVVNTDPFTGQITPAAVLPTGPLRVASFNATGALAFSDATPQEGPDGFSVQTTGTRYDDPSLVGVHAIPGGTTISITAPVTMRELTIGVSPLTVNVSGLSSAKYDAAQLVISDVAGIVATVDIASLIGSGASVQTNVQLPSGVEAASLGGTAIYQVSVRAWKRATPTEVQWARAGSLVDLRSAATATATVTVP